MPSSLPIGVFDSGLGGLSVLKELHRIFPNENFLYLGDVARLPYGTKSGSVVSRYAFTCVEFLLKRKVKLVVIACNTATAMALDELKALLPIDICGVIEPGAAAAREATRNKKVLVLATEATVKSMAYPREFDKTGGGLMVEQLACPLLVPLAEEGWFDHEVTRTVISTYLGRVKRKDFDCVLLGCTHYPLLEASFRAVLAPDCKIVHNAAHLARSIEERLIAKDLKNPQTIEGKLHFFSTDHIPKSLPIVLSLFGSAVPFELVDL